MTKSTDLASLAKSFQSLKQKLEDTETRLATERRERETDADTIAEMLVRIVALERNLRDATAAGARERDSRPPADVEALRRIATLEARAEEAEARARNAEARASEADARARAEHERAETLGRDHDALRRKFADAEVRARSEHDRAAHADEVARAARARAIELAERLDASPPTRNRDLGAELARERERHQRELDDVQQRNAAALRDAHEAYADAFRKTLEEEREIAREEVEQERTRLREANARVTELEDRLRAIASKHEGALAEIERLMHDRDTADRQSRLLTIQLEAAEAKLELVHKQLERLLRSDGLELGADVTAGRAATPEKPKATPQPGRRRSTRPPRRS